MMPGRGGPGGRGAYFESVLKFAPILGGALFLVVVLALVRNCMDSRANPYAEEHQFDAVRDFSKINSRGMMAVAMQKSRRNDGFSASSDDSNPVLQ